MTRMMGLMSRRLAVVSILAGLTAGCSWFRGSPEPPVSLADRMRKDPVSLERLRAAAAEASQRNVLWLREAYLAELALGATTETVRRRWGEPTRVRQTALGTWWEYDETYPKPGATPEPTPSDQPPDERREPNVARVGMNLRLLFVEPAQPVATATATSGTLLSAAGQVAVATAEAAVAAATQAALTSKPATPAPTPQPAATEALPPSGTTPEVPAVAPISPLLPTPTPKPKVLAHIQAWAPARFQTKSLVRVLDQAVRIERKYGKAPKVLPWGHQGGEVWLYPAANVAFVVTPAWEEQPRYVAATLVGF